MAVGVASKSDGVDGITYLSRYKPAPIKRHNKIIRNQLIRWRCRFILHLLPFKYMRAYLHKSDRTGLKEIQRFPFRKSLFLSYPWKEDHPSESQARMGTCQAPSKFNPRVLFHRATADTGLFSNHLTIRNKAASSRHSHVLLISLKRGGKRD